MSQARSYLLDTMAVLWLAFLPQRLAGTAHDVILDEETNLAFSIVSLWEIGLKLSVGGYRDFQLPNAWEILIPEGLKRQGITAVGIDAEHCRRIQDLPFHHRDPFDRMLTAQCQVEGRSIVSSDTIFVSYGVERVW